MKPSLETRLLFLAIRGLMKERKLKYRHLAKHLGVSVPTVKRMFSHQEMSLSRLMHVCTWLGVTIGDLDARVRAMEGERHFFAEDQERFFAASPGYLAYLMALRSGRTPSQIASEKGLSAKSTSKYLRQLRRFGLIEQVAGDQIRVLVRGTFSWDDHGVLGQTLSRRMILGLAEHAATRLADPEQVFVQLTGWMLTDANLKELRQDLAELANKYRQVSAYNGRAIKRSELKFISTLSLAAEWDDGIFKRIPELA